MSLLRPGSVFKSLETDKEFIARVSLKVPWYTTSYYAGPGLDDEIWACFQMQRRIIERDASQPATR